MTRPTFAATAEAIAYALGEPPDRTDWAVALIYDDGETRIQPADDETEARSRAEVATLEASTRKTSGTLPVAAYATFQEVRVLPDGTQIISPWMGRI